MNTTVEIKAYAADTELAQAAIKRAFSVIKEVDEKMNYYDPDSRLSYINTHAAEKPISLDDELYYIVDKCLKFGKITDGAFDITATSLDEPEGYKYIRLNQTDKTIYFADSRVRIDLGAAAKGYALDKAAESLEASGVEYFLINAGGDIRLSHKRNNQAWAVGLRDPLKKGGVLKSLYLKDRAVATSGNYLRSHIINTGAPGDKPEAPDSSYEVLSASVIASSGLEADILATSLYLMGKKGLGLIEELESTEGLLVIRENGKNGKEEILTTVNFSGYQR